jgi:predicted permease
MLLSHLIRKLRRRLHSRARQDIELEAELTGYLELLTEEKRRAGMPLDDARRAAMVELGGMELVKEQVRDTWSGEWFRRIVRDCWFALRMLRRNALLSGAIVLTLALAIGSNTAIFTVVDSLLLRKLPVEHPERLVTIHLANSIDSRREDLSLVMFDRLRSASQSSVTLAAYDFTRLSVRADGEAEPAEGILLSGNGFAVLGLSPFLGRTLDPSDDLPGRPLVAVLSHRYWQSRFNASPAVLGSSINLSGIPATVIGVLPRTFTGLTVGTSEGDVWIPLAAHRSLALRDHNQVRILARLSDGKSSGAAEAELTQRYQTALADSIGSSVRADNTLVSGKRVVLQSVAYGLGSGMERPLQLLMLAGILILLVVCANLGNLLLARAIGRRREIVVRIALGASRWSVIQQMLLESLVLAALAGALGLLIAGPGSELLAHYLTTDVDPITLGPGLDPRVVAFALVLSLVATLVFTVIPVLSFSRADIQSGLRSAATAVRGTRSTLRLGRLLVALQVALSVVLLVTAGVLVRSVQHLSAIAPGFDRKHTLLFAVYPGTLGYAGEKERSLYRDLRQRLEAIPGVRSAATSRNRLASGGREVCASPGDSASHAGYGAPVSPRFFETMGIPLVEGREFLASDAPDAQPVAVLSRAAANVYFPGTSALNKTIGIEGEAEPRLVVGVAGDVESYSSDPADRGLPSCNVYIPVDQSASTHMGQQWIEARVTGEPAVLLPEVRRAVHDVDKNLSVYWLSTVARQVSELYNTQTSLAALAGLFGTLALAFAAIGLFGVVSFNVASRTSELGLRLALGASRSLIMSGIVADTLRIVLVGAVAGGLGAVAAVRLTEGLLYDVSPADPVSLLGAIGVLLFISVLAALGPARRASRLDPAVTLRAD